MNIQGGCPFGLTGLMSLQSKGLLSLPQHHNSKASIEIYISMKSDNIYTEWFHGGLRNFKDINLV